MAQDHHDRAVRVHSLRHAEVVDAVIGNDVCQVVLWREHTLSIMQSVSDRKSRCQSLALGQCHCISQEKLTSGPFLIKSSHLTPLDSADFFCTKLKYIQRSKAKFYLCTMNTLLQVLEIHGRDFITSYNFMQRRLSHDIFRAEKYI